MQSSKFEAIAHKSKDETEKEREAEKERKIERGS